MFYSRTFTVLHYIFRSMDFLSSFLHMVQGTVDVFSLSFFFAYECPTPFIHFLSPLAPLILLTFISCLLYLSRILFHIHFG